jgi:hypothetical protein
MPAGGQFCRHCGQAVFDPGEARTSFGDDDALTIAAPSDHSLQSAACGVRSTPATA